jgi:hypothetical protein
MKKSTVKILGVSLAVTAVAICLAMMKTHPVVAQSSSAPSSRPAVNQPVAFGISPPLSELAKEHPSQPRYGFHQAEPVLYPKLTKLMEMVGRGTPMVGALQKLIMPATSIVPGLNLLGVGTGFPNYQVPDAPPDDNLAVGTTQVVQWVNTSYAVFNKTTGAVELGPIEGNLLWAGLPGSACANNNDGDILPQFDKLANRWVMSQNVFAGPPYYTCIAVSKTNDATGQYYEYEYPQPGFPDYPKIATWPDAYYQAQNDFGSFGQGFAGVNACAYDRSKLDVGDNTALQICFLDSSNGTLFDDSMLPGDLDSAALPPSGEPEVYVGSIDNANPGTNVYMYLFHVDFANPNDSTFTGENGAMPIAVNSYGLACGGFNACIQQPGTTDVIDSLGDRLMYRLSYVNVNSAFRSAADHQSWVVSHSVTAGNSTGARWYQFESSENDENLHAVQQGTVAPDSNYRWMPTAGQDKKGDIFLGYSVSSTSVYPSISYTGRTPSDPPNTMETEASMFVGTGSQLDTANRWGDYDSVSIDPQDYCTLWYTNEYYTTTSTFNWSTRVGSFKFPNCN